MKLVFVSSTFKDMQFERDKFHSHVAPLLDAKLEERGEAVYFGDLRWGVNTSDLDSDESNKKVLSVCLDEIDNCKPFMIVLIGERYGWIPGEELIKEACTLKGIDVDPNISVTHLEIEYGALLRPEYRGRVIFYFRELDKTGMTEAERKDYESESPLHAQKIKELKDKITELYPEQVRTYKARWDAEKKAVVDFDPLLDMVSKDLEAAFDLDEEPFKNLPWQEKARHAVDGYFSQEGRDIMDYMDLVIHLGDPVGQTSTITLYEGPTMEITAYLRHDYNQGKERGKYEVAGFVYGLDPYSKEPFNMIRMLLYKLEEMTDNEHQFLEDEVDKAKVIDRVGKLLFKIKRNLVFFIDNADQDVLKPLYELFDDLNENKYESMMLNSMWRENIFFQIGYSQDAEKILVPPFPTRCARFEIANVKEGKEIEYINYIAKDKHKEISRVVAEAIVKREYGDSGSIYHGKRDPYYYRLITERLLMLDSEDFANIRKMGDGMDNINKYMISIVNRFNEYSTGLSKELIKEASERIDKKFVYRFFVLLYAVKDFLPEKQIEYAFEKMGWEFSTLNFSLLVKSFGFLMAKRPVDNAYKLSYRSAVYEYIKDNKEEVNDIIAFMKSEKDIHAFFFKYKLTVASCLSNFDTVSDTIIDICQIEKTLSDKKDILDLRKSMGLMTNKIFASVLCPWDLFELLAKKAPDINFSFLLDFLPTAYLDKEEFNSYFIGCTGIFHQMEAHSANDKAVFLTAIAKAIKIAMPNGLKATDEFRLEYDKVANQSGDILAELKARLAIVRNDLSQGRSALYSPDDIYEMLYIEHAMDGTLQQEYYETIYKAQVNFVVGKFLINNEYDIPRGEALIYDTFSDLLHWGAITDESVLRLISFDDVYALIKEYMDYYKEHENEEYNQSALMTMLRLVRIGAQEVGLRAYGLLADIMEGVIPYQDIDDKFMMIDGKLLAIADVLSKRHWIEMACETDINHVGFDRGMAELALHLMDRQISPASQEFEEKYLNYFKGGISHCRQILDSDRENRYLFYDIATAAFYMAYYYVVYGRSDSAYSLYSYITTIVKPEQVYMPQFCDFVINAFHYLFGYDQVNVKNAAVNDYNALIATEDGQAILEKHRGLVEAVLGMFGF